MIRSSRGARWLAPLLMLPLLAMPARADNTPTFYADPTSHCSAGTFYPEAGLSVHWTGACVAGKADGAGIAEWQVNGAFKRRVEGEFRAGLPEGRLISTVASAGQTVRWEAEFRAGRMNGRCVMTKPDARVDAQCVDDQFNGSGVATFPSGSRYEGEFHDGHMSGRGVYFGTPQTGGARLEGNFTDGVLNGPGRQVFPRESESYEGDFVNGEKEGTGRYSFGDGNIYEGEWAHDLPNGRGVLHGITHGFLGEGHHDYIGTWVNGCFHQEPYTAELFKTRAECGFSD